MPKVLQELNFIFYRVYFRVAQAPERHLLYGNRLVCVGLHRLQEWGSGNVRVCERGDRLSRMDMLDGHGQITIQQ